MYVVNDKSQGSIAKHLSLHGLFYYIFITQFANETHTHTHTHTHPFNGPLFGTTRVSRYHKGKTNLDFTEATYSEW